MLSRLFLYFKGLNWKLDRVAYKAYPMAGLRGAARSIYKWLIPFGTFSWRTQPSMAAVFFGFHSGVIFLPPFLLAHNLFLEEKLGFSFFTLNNSLADLLAWIVIGGAFFLILRRVVLPEEREAKI